MAIPVLEEHWKYLKFPNKDHLYKFTCLPNGYFHGPWKLTKVLKHLLSKLRLNKITIVAYLDDCLDMDKKERTCWENTKAIAKTFSKIWSLLTIQSLNLPST